MKSEGDNLTPEEMREWLRQELADLTKAMELRVQDATDFVTGYALGKLSPEQAMKRLSTYEYRWGDSPIQGVITDPAMTNEAILRQLDEALPSAVRKIIERREKGSSHPKPNL